MKVDFTKLLATKKPEAGAPKVGVGEPPNSKSIEPDQIKGIEPESVKDVEPID